MTLEGKGSGIKRNSEFDLTPPETTIANLNDSLKKSLITTKIYLLVNLQKMRKVIKV